jgi:hypothetical protein
MSQLSSLSSCFCTAPSKKSRFTYSSHYICILHVSSKIKPTRSPRERSKRYNCIRWPSDKRLCSQSTAPKQCKAKPTKIMQVKSW